MGEAVEFSKDPLMLVSRDGTLEVATMELPDPDGGMKITTAVFRNGKTVARVQSVSRAAARVTHDAYLAAYRVAVGEEEIWAATALEALTARGYLHPDVGGTDVRFSPKGRDLWVRLKPVSPQEDRPIRVEVQVPADAWTPAENLPEKCQKCPVRVAVKEACLHVGLSPRSPDRQPEAGIGVSAIALS